MHTAIGFQRSKKKQREAKVTTHRVLFAAAADVPMHDLITAAAPLLHSSKQAEQQDLHHVPLAICVSTQSCFVES